MNTIKSSFSDQEDKLVREKYILEDNAFELINENDRLLGLENDIKIYNNILPLLLESASLDTIRRLYNIDAYFLIDDERVELPMLGDLYTQSESVTFILSFDPIEDISDEGMDKLLKDVIIAPVFRALYYPSSLDSVQTNDLLQLKYDLEVYEEITFKLTTRFMQMFSLPNETLKIIRYNPEDYKKGSDYYVNQLMTKHMLDYFTVYVEEYIDVEENYVIYRRAEEGVVLDDSYNNVVNIVDGAVGTSGESHNLPLDTDDIPYKILPESIILGYEWDRFREFGSIITSIDYEVILQDTKYTCVEVTHVTPSGQMRTYYAEGIGEVLMTYNDQLIRKMILLEYE